MKISKAELQQIIKEEAIRMKKIIDLKKELYEIENQLNEVHAGGAMDSERNDGVHAGQKKPVFDKKGSALVETGEDVEECGVSDGMTPGIMETEEEAEVSVSDEMGDGEVEGEETEEVEVLEPEEATEKIIELEAEVAEIKEKIEGLEEEETEEHVEGGSEEIEGEGNIEGEESIEGAGSMDESAKPKAKTIISAELSRMKKLAGL